MRWDRGFAEGKGSVCWTISLWCRFGGLRGAWSLWRSRRLRRCCFLCWIFCGGIWRGCCCLCGLLAALSRAFWRRRWRKWGRCFLSWRYRLWWLSLLRIMSVWGPFRTVYWCTVRLALLSYSWRKSKESVHTNWCIVDWVIPNWCNSYTSFWWCFSFWFSNPESSGIRYKISSLIFSSDASRWYYSLCCRYGICCCWVYATFLDGVVLAMIFIIMWGALVRLDGLFLLFRGWSFSLFVWSIVLRRGVRLSMIGEVGWSLFIAGLHRSNGFCLRLVSLGSK